MALDLQPPPPQQNPITIPETGRPADPYYLWLMMLFETLQALEQRIADLEP